MMYRPLLVILLLNVELVLSQQRNWKDEAPFLLVLDRKSLLKIDINNSSNYKVYKNNNTMLSIVAIDYDYEKEFVFYTDVGLASIKRLSFTSGRENFFANEEIIVSTEINTPDGICVDWVNERVYWTDTHFNRIEVCKYDGTLRTNLFGSVLDEPRAIAVDPSVGWMFWSDWGREPKIERATMAGTQREVLAKNGLQWPNGLTLDYDERRVYWIDAKFDVIESMDYDGSGRNKIIFSTTFINHPFSLDIFEENIYWTDWSPINAVNKVEKHASGKPKRFFNIFSNTVFGIRVFHDQKRGNDFKVCHQCNPCLPSELCLATPKHTGEAQVTYKCVKSNSVQNSTNSAGDAIADKSFSILISADEMEIMWILPNGSHWLANVPGIYAIDYLFDTETIFFTNVRKREINSASLKHGGIVETLVTNVDCNSSEGITVDWVDGLVYWVDTNINSINVFSVNSNTWTTLISQNISQLRAIEVDSISGWLFWTSCGPSPQIERSALDGRQRKIILSKDIMCPNGLALDIEERILYFYDASKGLIETVDYQGENRRIIVSTGQLGHANSLDVFQDYLYWTDGGKMYHANKCDGRGMKALDSFGVSLAADIHIFHKDKQKHERNVCQNSQCSHLCLPTINVTGEMTPTCACPAEMYLNEDDLKSCSYMSFGTSNYGLKKFQLNRALPVLSILPALFLQWF